MTDYYVKDGENYVLATDKLVPERDLMALKASKENGEAQSTAKIAELTDSVDKLTVRATTAEAERTTLTAELEPLKVEAAKVPQLTEQVTSLTTKAGAAEGQLLDTRRDAFISKYGITAAETVSKVKSMTAEQLQAHEESATLFGVAPGTKPAGPAPVIRGDGGRVDSPQSALATIHAGLGELATASS